MSQTMNIHIEYRQKSGFSEFFGKIGGRRVCMMYDVNTAPYARAMKAELSSVGCEIVEVSYPDRELIPTEEKCALAEHAADGCDYVLAVGSGTLNDMAKSVATRRGIPSGVLATAASMDGYCSSGAALMRGGVKVTDTVNAPSDVLIDTGIVCHAPKNLTAAGFGDILGKYTCLADWRLANLLKDEAVHEEAYAMMEAARGACVAAYDGLTRHEDAAVCALMDALVAAGIAMATCGNSRPASGSEHHQSHFLEMDFVRRGERVPEHGVKVAIGTLVSLHIYRYVAEHRVPCRNAEAVWALAESLPSEEWVREMLVALGSPVRFSEIGVREETMREMLHRAHTVRDRYTVLTFAHECGFMEALIPELMERYF